MEIIDNGREVLRFEPYFETLYHRYSKVEKFLGQEQANEVLEHVAALPLKKADSNYKRARQNFDRFALHFNCGYHDSLEYFMSLGSQVTDFVRSGQFVDSSFALFKPEEVSVQRYRSGGLISPHQDLTDNPIVIAILSLGDDAYLDIYQDDRQTVITSMLLKHGDLALLGASGLGNSQRPVHALRVGEDARPDYERYSVTYRGLRRSRPDLGYDNA